MQKVTLSYFNEHIEDIFNGECPKVYYCVHEQTEVNYGREQDCDLEYCNQNNIPAYMMQRNGGTIVCSKGNIGVSAITDVNDGWQCQKFIAAFMEWLRSFNLNVATDNNDILIDGYKVASCVELRVEQDLSRIYSTYQISINQDITAIEHICKKQMVKEPKALSDYGLTTEQVEQWCINYFKQMEDK